jgi:hypothetical protein
VRLESRIVVGRRRPMGTRRTRLEVPTTPEAVALGHLATHVDDLAIPGKLPEDSANSQGLELLNWSFSSVRRCRWGSCLRDLLIVVHVRALSPRRWRQSGLWSLKAYDSVGLNATHRRSLSARAGAIALGDTAPRGPAQRSQEPDHRDDGADHRKHAANRRCTHAHGVGLALRRSGSRLALLSRPENPAQRERRIESPSGFSTVSRVRERAFSDVSRLSPILVRDVAGRMRPCRGDSE